MVSFIIRIYVMCKIEISKTVESLETQEFMKLNVKNESKDSSKKVRKQTVGK